MRSPPSHTSEGRERAKARGVKLGRKSNITDTSGPPKPMGQDFGPLV
jgi:hypothetical protein